MNCWCLWVCWCLCDGFCSGCLIRGLGFLLSFCLQMSAARRSSTQQMWWHSSSTTTSNSNSSSSCLSLSHLQLQAAAHRPLSGGQLAGRQASRTPRLPGRRPSSSGGVGGRRGTGSSSSCHSRSSSRVEPVARGAGQATGRRGREGMRVRGGQRRGRGMGVRMQARAIRRRVVQAAEVRGGRGRSSLMWRKGRRQWRE